jgi:hypothetical protein
VRRRQAPVLGVPERLARFVASEWPDADDPIQAWKEACADWLAEDSEREPHPGHTVQEDRWWLAAASRRRLPFGEYGGALDVIREGRRKRVETRG